MIIISTNRGHLLLKAVSLGPQPFFPIVLCFSLVSLDSHSILPADIFVLLSTFVPCQ